MPEGPRRSAAALQQPTIVAAASDEVVAGGAFVATASSIRVVNSPNFDDLSLALDRLALHSDKFHQLWLSPPRAASRSRVAADDVAGSGGRRPGRWKSLKAAAPEFGYGEATIGAFAIVVDADGHEQGRVDTEVLGRWIENTSRPVATWQVAKGIGATAHRMWSRPRRAAAAMLHLGRRDPQQPRTRRRTIAKKDGLAWSRRLLSPTGMV